MIKWAIFGAGNISNTFVRNIRQVENSKIVAVASKNKEKLKNFCRINNISSEFCYSNYSELMNLNFDIAYVGLINSLHEEVINCLAKNNKNILTEKPAFLNIKDFNKNLEIIKKNKIFFMESMMYLHHPQFNKILKIINNNEIGKIFKLDYKLGFDIRRKFFGFKKKINFLSRLTDPKLHGGAINDIGCYPISFSNKLANIYEKNSPDKIESNGKIGLTGVDEYANIKVKYLKNNFISDLTVSINKKQDGVATIYGTKGKLIIPNLITPKKNYSLIVNEKEYNFFGNDLYTYIVRDTQNYLNNNICEPNKEGQNWSEMKLNCEMIDLWKSQIYKTIK